MHICYRTIPSSPLRIFPPSDGSLAFPFLMAGNRVAVVGVDSPTSPCYAEKEEDMERSQKAKLREMIRSLEEEPEEVKTLIELSKKLSLSGGGEDRGDAGLSLLDEEDEVFIVGETGEVALKDYPHSRYLCGNLPFSRTPHENYCDQCYCYVCDIPAPCGLWKENSHCDATDQDGMWKNLREAKRPGPQAC